MHSGGKLNSTVFRGDEWKREGERGKKKRFENWARSTAGKLNWPMLRTYIPTRLPLRSKEIREIGESKEEKERY